MRKNLKQKEIVLKKKKEKETAFNRYFTKGDTQKVNKHMKSCSTLLVIVEMQIKTILMYHFILIRMAIITMTENKVIIKKKKKTGNNKC